MLPEKAIETLRAFRVRMYEPPMEIIRRLERDEYQAVFTAQEEMDAGEHAEWAARHLVDAIRNSNLNASAELRGAKEWYLRILAKRYLVKSGWIEQSFNLALEMSIGGGN